MKKSDKGEEMLPVEWKILKTSEIASNTRNAIVGGPFGSDLVSSDYVEHGVPVIRGQNMGQKYLTGPYVFVGRAKAKYLEANLARPYDLVFTQRGTLGQISLVPLGPYTEYLVSQSQMKLSVNTELADEQYFYYVYLSNERQKIIGLRTIQTGLPHINLGILKEIPVPVPPLHEQRAIAAALSDIDALIAGLDQLIAKKRALKQATMQQLLTGQKRLPGFREEWKKRRLGDHVIFLRNGVSSRAELQPEGNVRYLHYGDVHASERTALTPHALPCLPQKKAATLDRLCDGDLIFADASEDLAGVSKSVELQAVGSAQVVSGLHTIAARFDKTILADGFKAYLQFCPPFARHLRQLAAGTKVLATNRAHIATVEMHLPSVEEQSAIATILSDMDAELAALEQRRDKTRLLKQGMMQELLTGRIRLVEAAATQNTRHPRAERSKMPSASGQA